MLAIFSMGGPWEYIIVLVIILILWGPGKLPQVLSQLGKGVRSFKDGMKDGEDTVNHWATYFCTSTMV